MATIWWAKLMQISPSTVDRLLAGERSRLRLTRYRRSAAQRLLLESIPVKLHDEWDRAQIGNPHIDSPACPVMDPGSAVRACDIFH